METYLEPWRMVVLEDACWSGRTVGRCHVELSQVKGDRRAHLMDQISRRPGHYELRASNLTAFEGAVTSLAIDWPVWVILG